MTRVGIIGAGHIGSTLARGLAERGYEVVISNSRGPETLTTLAGELGPNVSAGTVTDAAASGDVVIVSHQLPIWVTHLAVAGLPARHDPRRRRCALSSVTSFDLREDRWVEVAYAEPASTAGAVDVGAV